LFECLHIIPKACKESDTRDFKLHFLYVDRCNKIKECHIIDVYIDKHNPVSSGHKGLSLEIKLLRREADHSPPSSVKVKNEWSWTSITPYVGWCSA